MPAPLIELLINIDNAKADWDLGPNLKIVRDEILQRDVIERTGDSFGWIASRKALPNSGYEVIALVRMVDTDGVQGATLSLGASGPGRSPETDCFVAANTAPKRSAKAIHITTSPGSTASDKESDDSPKARPARGAFFFEERFKEISPVWDADFRQEIEAAMSGVPLAKDTWVQLRVVRRPEVLQIYSNGYLVAERRPAVPIEGNVHLKLNGNVRVGALLVRPLAGRHDGFQPVEIDALCNSKAGTFNLQAASLPTTRSVTVNSIPFVFPRAVNGNDQIDVGASLHQHRNEHGQFEGNVTWPRPQSLDPNRIRISAPNRPYSRLWLIAASDGDPNHVPIVTVRFYRPAAGFPIDAVGNVPAITAQSGGNGTSPLPIKLTDGKDGNLWLVPIELDAVKIASEFREEETLAVEITKQVFPHRDYPDPANYSWYQGGLPSGVRIFAMTFEEAPIRLIATGTRWGNATVAPEQPGWRVNIENLRDQKIDARVRVTVVDPFNKTNAYQRTVALAAKATSLTEIPITTQVFGLHQVRTDVELSGGSSKLNTFSQEGTFIHLPPDTRKSTGLKSRWGLWNWNGTHGTNPNEDENLTINRMAGARYGGSRDINKRREYGMANAPQHLSTPPLELRIHGPAKWALKEPHDPAEYQKFSEGIGKKVATKLEANPDTPSFSIFTEAAVSPRLTYGVPPEYLGEGEYKMSEEEKKRFKAFMLTLKAATEGIRKHAPDAKIALGWCEPYFAVPFLKEKFPREMFDLFGVDSPQFERMPEMPIREIAPNRMWLLQQAMKKYGYENMPIIHTESYYPSSHPLALGFRASADSVVRSAVLSLTQGSTTFANCWTLQDCAGFWGAQHYGCVGLLGRQPEANPKPAFAAFATMTRLLDDAQFDGYVPTGSHTAYCVRFSTTGKKIHCLWTIRGTRPAKLSFAKSGEIVQTDENGNDTNLSLTDQSASISLSSTPVWIITPADAVIAKVEVGTPTFTEAPGKFTKLLDPLDKPWKYDAAEYGSYATNHWGMPRFVGPMKSDIVDSSERKAKVWQVALDKPAKERPLAAWYGVFLPGKPVEIPGRARALGIWVNGRSNWGRIVYEIEDARGERWQSIGTRDDWNCDDTHSWSYFNFDGWRYIEFPLPNHEPGDNYRGADTVWWNHNAEGVVDLPVKLTRIIIEQRTHNIYVNDLIELPDRSVQLSNLMAVYDEAELMTDAPVQLQRSAAGAIQIVKLDESSLANPIAELKQNGVGAAPEITKVAPPEHGYDGTRVEVSIKPVEGAKEYRVYVSARESGASAQQMAKSDKPHVPVTKLRAEFPLYLFVTYVDKDGRESKPTDARRILLKDDFPMK